MPGWCPTHRRRVLQEVMTMYRTGSEDQLINDMSNFVSDIYCAKYQAAPTEAASEAAPARTVIVEPSTACTET